MSREGTHLGCCAAHLSLLEPSTEAESPLLVLAAECVHYSSQQPQPESGHRAAAESAASTSQPSTSAPQTHRPTVFHGNRAPPISLVDYAKRIGKHTRVSPLCFIAALAYIDRLCRVSRTQRLRQSTQAEPVRLCAIGNSARRCRLAASILRFAPHHPTDDTLCLCLHAGRPGPYCRSPDRAPAAACGRAPSSQALR